MGQRLLSLGLVGAALAGQRRGWGNEEGYLLKKYPWWGEAVS